MENNNCHFQVGSLLTAHCSWQLALPMLIGADCGHNPYSNCRIHGWRNTSRRIGLLSFAPNE